MTLCCAHCPVSLVSFIWDSLQASFAFHDFQFEECRQLFCGLPFGAAWSSLTQRRFCRPGGRVPQRCGSSSTADPGHTLGSRPGAVDLERAVKKRLPGLPTVKFLFMFCVSQIPCAGSSERCQYLAPPLNFSQLAQRPR